ncbi:MAG: MBL fold metallo-hydrolase [Candidatus Pacebacteria bacterium]|nr:MBL fold metallo-hydrolase [Candidatus Paceibacterota bacterium]
MLTERIVVGLLQVNCYVAWNDETRDALIIDPGEEPERIAQRIRRLELMPRGILLTHGHVDHIRAVPKLVEAYSCPVMLHANDSSLYHSNDNELPPWLPPAVDLPEPTDVPRDFADLAFDVLHTPGHTPGGCSFYFPRAGLVFSGDTLFQLGVGRTDLCGGDMDTLLRSVRDVLFSLPAETTVYPGHGDATTIGYEKRNNPFVMAD